MNKLFKIMKYAKTICLIIVLCAGVVNTVQAFKAQSRYEDIKEENSKNADVELVTGDIPYVFDDGSDKIRELEAESEVYKLWCMTLSYAVLYWIIVSIDDEKLFGIKEEK